MQEVKAQETHFTTILGDNASIKNSGKINKLLSNENSLLSDLKPRIINEGENTIIVGAKTFIILGDSTHYPDPYTTITALPNSEFKIIIKHWEFIDKAKNEKTLGSKITKIELTKGIFSILTGSELKAKNVEFIIPKKKATIKIEISSNAIYIGGNDFKISGNFSKTPLNVSQFSEYIIAGNNFYKKSLIAMKEENRMDERFMAIDSLIGKLSSSAINISQYKDSDKMFEQIDKNVNEYNPDSILKSFENAMNMTPEMLKGSGLSEEQLKQATEGMAKLKKELTPDKMSEFKKAISGIKKEDLIKTNQSMKSMGNLAPKFKDIINEFDKLVPYGKLPSKLGECEEMEEL
ncbi:MAG: hypothetical protein PHN56_01815 [Candidatus Nanoarchaeia archaeon]|nr:hypothetical protein [Candidatus Nanoarchaeia archaeon]